MPVAATMALTGDKALIRTLDRLPAALVRRVVRPAVRSALVPINKAAKRKAPKETGLLKKSIGAVVKVYKRTGVIWGGVGPRKGFRQVIDGKPRDPVKYAHLVEFGTERAPAQAFLRPAFDENKGKAFGILKAKIAAGLIREAKRAKR